MAYAFFIKKYVLNLTPLPICIFNVLLLPIEHPITYVHTNCEILYLQVGFEDHSSCEVIKVWCLIAFVSSLNKEL